MSTQSSYTPSKPFLLQEKSHRLIRILATIKRNDLPSFDITFQLRELWEARGHPKVGRAWDQSPGKDCEIEVLSKTFMAKNNGHQNFT